MNTKYGLKKLFVSKLALAARLTDIIEEHQSHDDVKDLSPAIGAINKAANRLYELAKNGEMTLEHAIAAFGRLCEGTGEYTSLHRAKGKHMAEVVNVCKAVWKHF